MKKHKCLCCSFKVINITSTLFEVFWYFHGSKCVTNNILLMIFRFTSATMNTLILVCHCNLCKHTKEKLYVNGSITLFFVIKYDNQEKFSQLGILPPLSTFFFEVSDRNILLSKTILTSTFSLGNSEKPSCKKQHNNPLIVFLCGV
jgi:hypothetical protein